MSKWGVIFKRLILFTILPLLLWSYSDQDLDGVADEHDLCPNSTMSDIVDKNGCTIKKLKSPTFDIYHFDIIMGIDYTQIPKTDYESTDESLQLDLYYKNFTIQLQSTNYEHDGLTDTTIGVFYYINPINKLSLNLGVSTILPTGNSKFNNNNIDYKFSSFVKYKVENSSIFMGFSYTLINDDDINSSNYKISYKNRQNLYMGVGRYFTSKLYSSILYNNISSIYRGGKSSKNISIYNHYIINRNWFSRFGYSKEIDSNYNNHLYINIGYYF